MCRLIISAGGRFPAACCAASASRGAAQDLERRVPRPRCSPGSASSRDPRLEHRRVIAPARCARKRDRPARQPRTPRRGRACRRSRRARSAVCEQLEAALGDIGQQRVAVAEMAVGRRGADPGRARRVGEGEARPAPSARSDRARRGSAPRADCRDDSPCAARPVFRPAHVNGSYMSPVTKAGKIVKGPGWRPAAARLRRAAPACWR